MAFTISQAIAASYPKVLAEARKPTNLWAENAFMREMERLGFIESVNFGPTLEVPLDWRRNPNAGFMANELDPMTLTKTDVITAASYGIAELSVPIVWTKKDEATNPTENQKIALVKSLLTNGFDTHDNLVEEAIWAAATTAGFNSLPILCPNNGQGNVGGIDAAIDAVWRNEDEAYANAQDIDASLTTLWNEVIRSTGSSYTPKAAWSGATPHAMFEGNLQANQRYIDKEEGTLGFKVLALKTARYSFSQFGGDDIYLVNPKAVSLKTSKTHFRMKGQEAELEGKNGYYVSIYSALQFVAIDKGRLGVAHLEVAGP